MPGRLIAMAVAVSALTGVQVGIAKLAVALDAPLIFGLHALGGLAIIAVTATIARQSSTWFQVAR